MSQILIFSDNKALINLWSLSLASKYKINLVNDIHTHVNAAVIISSQKIEENKNLLSFCIYPPPQKTRKHLTGFRVKK